MRNANAVIEAFIVNNDENVEKNPYSFHNIFKQVVAFTRKHHVPATDIFKILPHENFPWYCEKQFMRSYQDSSEGEILEGILSKQLAESILEGMKALQNHVPKKEKKLSHKPTAETQIANPSISELNSLFHKLVTVEIKEPELKPSEPNYLGYDEFNALIGNLEKESRVSFHNAAQFFPKEFRSHSKLFVGSQENGKKRPIVQMSFELVSHVAAFYDALPNVADPAQRDHIALDKQFDDKLSLQMKAVVAKEQIAQGMNIYKKSPRRLIEAMAEQNYPVRSVELLLLGRTGEFVSRRLVAAVLEQMGVFDVQPMQNVEQKKAVLSVPDSVMDVRPIASTLTNIFNSIDADDMVIHQIYNYMPPAYQEAIDVDEIDGWFDGRVTLARKDMVSMFMNATISKFNAVPGKEAISPDQIKSLNSQSGLRLVR